MHPKIHEFYLLTKVHLVRDQGIHHGTKWKKCLSGHSMHLVMKKSRMAKSRRITFHLDNYYFHFDTAKALEFPLHSSQRISWIWSIVTAIVSVISLQCNLLTISDFSLGLFFHSFILRHRFGFFSFECLSRKQTFSEMDQVYLLLLCVWICPLLHCTNKSYTICCLQNSSMNLGIANS